MENSYRFFENRDCIYYPCHKGLDEINCLFCYCPLYRMEKCAGNPEYKEIEGKRLKICTGCNFPHQAENYDKIIKLIIDSR